MKYVQTLLKHDNIRQVCWLRKDEVIKGMHVVLKDVDKRVWIVEKVWSSTVIEKENINVGWHVGGL